MSYVRNAWYVAAWEKDLPPDTPIAVSILGEGIVLVRDAAGVFALANRCAHRMAPLSLGRCESNRLRCLYHGVLFERDGKAIEIPGQEIVPDAMRVRSYPVEIRDSWIWVWMGAPERADASLIPAAIGFDNPDYILAGGFLDYETEATLINDNLLDFSHVPYVHARSFQATDDFATEPPKIEALDRGVRVSRWIKNAPPSPMSNGGDIFQSYDYLIPGVLVMLTGCFKPGTADALALDAPHFSSDRCIDITATSQAVTPTGDRRTRYFFSVGPGRRFGDQARCETQMAVTQLAFDEDKTMIEGQQQVIDRSPVASIMPTTHDRAVTIFNRIVERLAKHD